MTDAGHGEGPAVVEGRQVELELRVLDRVGGEHVRPEGRHAPLEALAQVPDLAPVGAPRREVAREPDARVREESPAEESVGAVLGRVAIGARVVALTDAPVEARLPAQDRPARQGASASSASNTAGLFVGSRLSPKPTGFWRVAGLRSGSRSAGAGPLSVWR